MENWRQMSVITSLLITLAMPATAQTRYTAPSQEGGIRPTMQAIFQALTTIVPLSLSGDTFQDTANRQSLHDALQALANHATQLTQHGQATPADFDFLRRSLRDDAQNAFELFESEDFEESRFIIQHLTDKDRKSVV